MFLLRGFTPFPQGLQVFLWLQEALVATLSAPKYFHPKCTNGKPTTQLNPCHDSVTKSPFAPTLLSHEKPNQYYVKYSTTSSAPNKTRQDKSTATLQEKQAPTQSPDIWSTPWGTVALVSESVRKTKRDISTAGTREHQTGTKPQDRKINASSTSHYSSVYYSKQHRYVWSIPTPRSFN